MRDNLRGQRLRIRALVVLGLGFVLLAGWLALRAERLGGQARVEIVRALSAASGLDVHVRDAELELSHFAVVAHGIELNAGDRHVLSARELRIGLSLRAFLAGHVELRAVEVASAELRLTEPRDANALWDRIKRRPSSIDAVRVRDLHLVVAVSAQRSVELEHADIELASSRVRLHAEHAALQVVDGHPARGRLRFEGTLRGHGDAMRGEGRLDFDSVRIASGTAMQRVALDWRADKARVDLKGTWTLAAGAGTLAFAAGLPLVVGSPVELRAQPHALHLAAALAQLGAEAPNADAVVDGEVTLRGSVQSLSLSGPLQVDARAVRVGGAALGGKEDKPPLLELAHVRAAANARLDTMGLVLDELSIEPWSGTIPKRGGSGSEGALHGDARVGYGGDLSLALAGDGFDLGTLSPLGGIELAGRGRFSVQAHGVVRALRLHAGLDMQHVAAAGLDLEHVIADLELDDAGRILRFARLEVSGAERKLSSETLELQLDSGIAAAKARLHIARLPLLDLYRLLGAADDPMLSRFEGNAQGRVDLAYARSERLQKLELGLALELGDASLDGYRFDRGRLHAKIAIPDAARGLGHGTLTLEELALHADDGRVGLSGRMEQGALSMQISISKLALRRLPWVHAHLGTLDGRIEGSGQLLGSSSHARADMQLALSDLELGGQRLGRVELRAALRDRKAASQLVPGTEACSQGRAALSEGQLGPHEDGSEDEGWLICGGGLADHLRVDLVLGTNEERRVRGSLSLDGLDIGAFLPEQTQGKNARGKLSASLEFSAGGLARPDHLSGRLAVRRLELGEGALALANRAPFELRSREGALVLDGVPLEGPRLKLVLSAEGSLQKEPRLVLSGTAAASLFAQASEPLAQVFGDVELSLAWSPLAEPAVRGEAVMRDLMVRLGSGAVVRKLHGKLALQGERVRLEGVGAELGGGALAMDGELQLKGLRAQGYELGLKAQAVAFEPQPRLEVAFDADTHLAWHEGGMPPKLVGHVRVKRLLYGRHIQLPEALTALNRQDRAELTAYAPERDRLAFDLEVEHEQPLRIRNNLLDAELVVSGSDHKLRVVGSDQRFGVLGTLTVARGRVLFHGDEFQVARGLVSFGDSRRVAPAFDLRAVAEHKKRPDASIVFLAHGTRDAFDLAVRCEAGPAAVEPKPFACEYAHDNLRCDSFEQLARLWLCRSKAALSSAP